MQCKTYEILGAIRHRMEIWFIQAYTQYASHHNSAIAA